MLAAAISAVNAYGESLSDCQTFAAQFAGTCGGTAEGNAWGNADSATNPTNWGSGDNITCNIKSSSSLSEGDPMEFRSPNNGLIVTQATVNRKVCVTCRQVNL